MLTPTAIADFLACQHLITLDRAEAAGEIRKPFFADPGIDLLRRLGLEHEQAYLRGLRERDLQVVQIPSEASWVDAAAKTVEALHLGVDAVYQATFQEGSWGGRADFLLRVNEPSALGRWSFHFFARAQPKQALCLEDFIRKSIGLVGKAFNR
jgi:hypothetical protein